MDNLRVVIAAGGTAGHINPGIAVADRLAERNLGAEILFVGTASGLENDLVSRAGYPLKKIRVRGFKRKLNYAGIRENLKTLLELRNGMRDSKKILKEFKPDVVLGTGGYVCWPVLRIAAKMKIPTIVHESNSYPGLANKMLSAKVDIIATGFKEVESYLSKANSLGKLRHTGNPVKKEFLFADRGKARNKLGISDLRKLVVFVGGSRGAAHFNEAVADMVKSHYKGEYDIMHSTGESGYEKVMVSIESHNGLIPDGVKILPYIYNAADVYAAADLIVCRAGALTVAEMTAMGKPTIMVPSPYVAENHQEKNARVLENAGACILLRETDLTGELLASKVNELVSDDEKLLILGKNAKKLAVRDALDKICGLIEKLSDINWKSKDENQKS